MNDACVAPIWVAANLLFARSAWSLASYLFPDDTRLSKIIHTVVLGWSCISFSGQILGSFGILSGLNLALAMGVLSALEVWTLRTKEDRFVIRDKTKNLPSSQFHIWRGIWSIVGVFCASRILITGLLGFPDDWDTIMYHIPLIDNMITSKSISNMDCGVWYNPANNELIGFWMVSPFSGDFLISLNNVPACFLIASTAYELGGLLGLRPLLRHSSALAMISNMAFIRQMSNAGNDLPVAAFFIAGIFYGTKYILKFGTPNLIFGSMCFGITAGVKYFGLGYAIVSAGIVLTMVALRRPRLVLRVVAINSLAIILLSGSWYLRNAYVTGTPIFPAGYHSTNPDAEQYPDHTRGTLLGVGRPEVLPLVEDAIWKLAGPLNYLSLVALPAVLPWLFMSAFMGMPGRNIPGSDLTRILLVLATLGAGTVLLITPFAAETNPGSLNMLIEGYSPLRFGLGFYNLTLLCFVTAAEDAATALASKSTRLSLSSLPTSFAKIYESLKFTIRTIIVASCVLCAMCQLIFCQSRKLEQSTLIILLSIDTTLTLVFIFSALRLWPNCRKWLLRSVLFFCLAASSLTSWKLSEAWHAGFAAHYDDYFHTQIFSKTSNLEPSKNRIGVLDYRYYPFLGDARQFRAFQPKYVQTFHHMVKFLIERDINVVIARNQDPIANGSYVGRVDWMNDHPELFQPWWTDDTFSAFHFSGIGSGVGGDARDTTP